MTWICFEKILACCYLLAGLLLGTLAQLDQVLRSAARLVGGLSKFSSITAYMRDVGLLHWLPIILYLSGYSIVSLQWSPVVSLAAPPLTSATSAAQCRFWPHVGCCVLLRGVSFWSPVPVWLLCSEGPFRLWVNQHGMISPLSCVPCWWPTLPNFTSLLSPSFLSVTGLGAPLSSSPLKRRYISLQNE